MDFFIGCIGGASIDNLKDEGIDPIIAKNVGFDMNMIKRNELYINLIYFDKNMTNKENFEYFNNFKVDVVGGFHAKDDLTIFKKFLQEINTKKSLLLLLLQEAVEKILYQLVNNILLLKKLLFFV